MIPLTKLETAILKKIFQVRIKTFCAGYSFCLFWLLRLLYRFAFVSTDDLYKPYKKGIDFQLFGHTMTVGEMFYSICFFFGSFFLLTGIIIFKRRIYCFYKDFKNGVKEPIQFIITRKQDFPITNQYYFFLNDYEVKHFEVNEEDYNSFEVGDEIIIYRAPLSKYVFVKDAKFEVL